MVNNLLVVCTGNICRSPMAEALFAVRAKETDEPFQVASAGIGALIGFPPPDKAIELMSEKGMDISGHRARQITEPMARQYDLILVMEIEQKFYLEDRWSWLRGRVHRLCEHQGIDVMDPYRRSKKVFMESFGQIEQGFGKWSEMLFK